MTKFKGIINYIYKDVTLKGIYDVKEGNKPINPEDKICTIPKKMYDHINNGGKGCCFVFSSYMIYMMHQNGIKANMIMTKEDSGIRASVLYEDNGEEYVANPVQDIEYFTANHIPPETRILMYDGGMLITDNSAFDASRIPLDEFNRIHGKIDMLPNFYDDDMTLEEAMKNAETIRR